MAKKKKKAAKKRVIGRKSARSKFAQADLAESLARYINPDDKEFDLDFTIEVMRMRPDWFSDEERERVASWAKARTKKR
jgi:hypothetical protein